MATGTIRQRSGQRDRFTVQVYLGVSPVDGKKKYRSETVRGSRADAQRRLREMLDEVGRDEAVVHRRVALEDYLELWLRDYAPLKVRAVTLAYYRTMLKLYVIPRLGKVMLDRLTGRQIQGMEGELLRVGTIGGRPLSNRSVRGVHRVLQSALGDAARMGYIRRGVMGLVQVPREDRREMRLVTLEELRAILGRLSRRKDRLMFMFAAQTGIRRGELAGLQWRDIDWPGCSLSVQRRVALVDGQLDIAEPKSGRGRVVALGRESMAILEELWGAGGWSGSGHIFLQRDGGVFNPERMTLLFTRAARRAGFKGIRLHDLRHMHASLLLQQGVHLKVVQERLGHSSISITADLYSHVAPGVQRAAIERSGEIWKNFSVEEE